MRVARTVLLYLLVVFTFGCGYKPYNERRIDSVATDDYNQQISQTLGSPTKTDDQGISIRLPNSVSTSPVADEFLPEGMTVMFQMEEDAKMIPMTVVVFVSRESEDEETDLLDMQGVLDYVFQTVPPDQWMGPGADLSGLEPESRSIPAGPKLQRGQDRINAQMVTIKQDVAGENEGEQEHYIWKLFFLEQPEGNASVRAMIAFRVRADDLTAKYSEGKTWTSDTQEAIDMSITTARLIAATAAPTRSEGREKSGGEPSPAKSKAKKPKRRKN